MLKTLFAYFKHPSLLHEFMHLFQGCEELCQHHTLASTAIFLRNELIHDFFQLLRTILMDDKWTNFRPNFEVSIDTTISCAPH